jgi:hypothetical protein
VCVCECNRNLLQKHTHEVQRSPHPPSSCLMSRLPAHLAVFLWNNFHSS